MVNLPIFGLDIPSWLVRLEHFFQPNVTRFHSMLHASRKHGRSRLRIRQRHSHRHQSPVAVRNESGFDAVVRSRVWQIHSLDMHELVVGLKFEILAGNMESMALGIRPFIAELAARLSVVDAYGHGPSV